MPLSHLPGLLSDLQSYQSGLSAHWLQVLSIQETFVLFGQPIHWLEVLTIQVCVVLSGWSVHSPLTCSPTSINTSDLLVGLSLTCRRSCPAGWSTGRHSHRCCHCRTVEDFHNSGLSTHPHSCTCTDQGSNSQCKCHCAGMAATGIHRCQSEKQNKTWTHVNKFFEKKSETNNSSPSLFQVL